ncbi:GNAT family N-acetyltransferase [Thalassobellus citreus]|uniref:GNAT family N-acetyltransferase n=1 Tax=Thalassobellus citreus TaxID=3367752 RepID=UPI003789406A
MLKKILSTEHFQFRLFEKRGLQEFYKGVYNHHNKDSFLSKDEFKIIKKTSNQRLSRVNFVPPYLNLAIDESSKLKKIEINSIDKGYLANLKKHSSIEEYLLSQFSAKNRTKIRSNVKRLELCFNISYRFYYGNIQKKDYDFLFKNLYSLINTRFTEINKEHQALKTWDKYKESVYKMILNKSASIFVIYDDEKPIDICINYHFDNVFLNHIRSFDIDYSKFRLGYIDIYKQIEWCFENGFGIFDLDMGTLRYKKEWCNEVYTFKHHIIFNKKNILNHILVALTKTYTSMTKKIFQIKSTKKKAPHNKIETDKKYSLQNITLENFNTNIENYTELDIESEKNKHLRSYFYDFLYLTKNSKISTKIYNDYSTNKYIFKGKNKIQELELTT